MCLLVEHIEDRSARGLSAAQHAETVFLRSGLQPAWLNCCRVLASSKCSAAQVLEGHECI